MNRVVVRSALSLWLVMAGLGSFTAGSDPESLPPSIDTGPKDDLRSMSLEEIDALARAIAPKVEALRKQSFRSPVPVRIVDDAKAREHFQDRLRKFWPEARMLAEQTALIHLGLLPAGYALGEGLFEVLEEQTGGYYDPETNTFFVLDDMPRTSAPILIAHELTHALDDQLYDIDAILEAHAEDSDRAEVVAAVVEGSGTLVMSLFIIQELTAGRLSPTAIADIQQSEAGRGERLMSAPPYVKRGLLAPYLLGQTLMLRGHALTGLLEGVKPEDFDRAFRSPPVSTEQLLHPEKYWDPAEVDPPLAVPLEDLSPALGGSWSRIAEGNLGEINLAILTGAPTLDITNVQAIDPASWTNAAASGWGGDLWHLYGDGKRRLTLLATLWDTPHDAEEFADACAAPAGRFLALRRTANAVVLIAGDDPGREATEALAGRALELLAAPVPATTSKPETGAAAP